MEVVVVGVVMEEGEVGGCHRSPRSTLLKGVTMDYPLPPTSSSSSSSNTRMPQIRPHRPYQATRILPLSSNLPPSVLTLLPHSALVVMPHPRIKLQEVVTTVTANPRSRLVPQSPLRAPTGPNMAVGGVQLATLAQVVARTVLIFHHHSRTNPSLVQGTALLYQQGATPRTSQP